MPKKLYQEQTESHKIVIEAAKNASIAIQVINDIQTCIC